MRNMDETQATIAVNTKMYETPPQDGDTIEFPDGWPEGEAFSFIFVEDHWEIMSE